MSVLNNEQIMKYRDSGDLVIEPFNPKNLKTSSYDVRLGKYFYREQKPPSTGNPNDDIYNMYSEEMVKKVWGPPEEAIPYSFYKKQGIILENIKDDDLVIMIGPGESILGHTEEFIGAKKSFTSMLHTRSSAGRSMIQAHMGAGMGDVFFINRWTLEITNFSTQYKIPLVVGRRIAQVVFFQMEPIEDITGYHLTGKYQKSDDLNMIMSKWMPSDMLPKKYLDYEIKE